MNENSLEKTWQAVLDKLEQKLGNSRAMEIWIRPVKPVSFDDRVLTLALPNTTFQKGFLSFAEPVKEVFLEVAGTRPELQFVYGLEPAVVKDARNNLNAGYTFENFVVGPCNRLAHAAALAVAQSPGAAYNPLFLYGGVGLGKTHLMQAIGHFAEHGGSVKAAYLPCEIFVNSFIQSIQNKTTHLFRNRFRNLDVLLIDDIHFIAGKGGTQEEFFHTFNALYDVKKQIILSSDRPPKEIAFLEKRLISRFEWGLVVDIQPPDFETRVAILKKKCELKNMVLPDELCFYIAEHIQDNIRLLEGVLNRLLAYSSLLNQQVDMKLTEEVVSSVYQKEKKVINLNTIIEKVSEFFQVSPKELTSKRRIRNILIPRQIVMYLARELTESSLTDIAEELGGKDHTTVIHAYKKIKSVIETNEYLRDIIERIKKELSV